MTSEGVREHKFAIEVEGIERAIHQKEQGANNENHTSHFVYIHLKITRVHLSFVYYDDLLCTR